MASGASEPEALGPVARMMMSVAAHAITSYVQFRALAELLIERGVISREELENRFALSRERELERTIDEWFTPDIAYHLKMAVQSAMAQDSASPVPPHDALVQGSAPPAIPHTQPASGIAPPEADEVARARAMQSHTP